MFMKSLMASIIESTYEEVKAKHRSLSADELKEMGIVLIEIEFQSSNNIVDHFKTLYIAYQNPGDEHSSFYCGITNDMVIRKQKHESEDYSGKEIETVFRIKCKSREMAAEVEKLMSEDGFDTGNTDTEANGAVPDTDFVYMYRKPNK